MDLVGLLSPKTAMDFTQYVPPARLLTMAEIAAAELAELRALPRPALIRQLAVQELPPLPPPAPLVRHERYDDFEDEDELGGFAPMEDDEDGFAMSDDEELGGFTPMDE
jgi:hypothetical protein